MLATLGCPMTLVECSPVIFSLIEDAVERAALSDDFQPILANGFDIINADANNYIEQKIDAGSAPPDVIYIDPMFPQRKKSALVKKDMQILQHLHDKDTQDVDRENALLLENALHFAKKRVVVKRPIHAPSIGGRKPNTSIKSKKTRYDIYTIEKM